MAAELIKQSGKGISFGNYKLDVKSKQNDFEYNGDIYYVKSYYEVTRLEKNDSMIYESVPGTSVTDFDVTADEITFKVEGYRETQITVEMAENALYDVTVGGASVSEYKTNMRGKLVLTVDLDADKPVTVKATKK
ncbi:MAG: endosialidase [Lachnospiraceae bacterium]